MGHRRISSLPKSKKWQDISRLITAMPASESQVADVAQQTIDNVRTRFLRIEQDKGVSAAFRFLIELAVASHEDDPQATLANMGIELPDQPTPLALGKALGAWMESKRDSLEYGELARQAAGDAIAMWVDRNRAHTPSLFESTDPFDVWRKAGTGAGFCQLSRLFFAKFTQRYLEYFLERSASAVLRDIDKRIEFKQRLEKHVDTLSQHAFETAKITQSFAAGWFNKHAKEGVPSEKKIKGFLSHAFGKIRDELQRDEARGK